MVKDWCDDKSLTEGGFQKQSDKQQPSAARRTYGDYYFMALGGLLAGYAIGGKVFAYISIGPVYIGDVVLAFGIIALLISRCAVASLATLPSLLLGVLMGWAIIRVLPYLGEFGIDALRDSVVVLYGGFAFIVTALLLERPDRLALTIQFLRVVGSIVILIAPILLLLNMRYETSQAQGGLFTPPDALACHLAGVGLLMLLGFKRAGMGWCILMLVGMGMASALSRGALFSIIIPITLAAIVTGKLRALGVVVVPVACLLCLTYTIDLSPESGTRRQVSAKQLVENVVSTFDSSGSADDGVNVLERTRTWRLEWWKTIFNYTFNGPYFWTGKGFGANLAEDDGFFIQNPDQAPLRSPHTSHIDILARTGVPGLALWVLMLGAWSTLLLANVIHARMRDDNAWAEFFVLIFCYALAFLVDAAFAMPLEGPMLGIWFWSLIGVGIGGSMIYRACSRGVEQNSFREARTRLIGNS